MAAAALVAAAALAYITLLMYDPILAPFFDVIPPFVIAFVVAFLLDPLVDWFERKGTSRDFGVAIVGLLFIVVFVVAGMTVIPKIAEQASGLAVNFEKYVDVAQKQFSELMIREKPLLERFHLPTSTSAWTQRFSQQIESTATNSLNFVSTLITSALSRIMWIIIIPLATLWILKDLDYIKAKIVHYTPSHRREKLIKTSSAIGSVFGKYIRGMMTVAIIYSIVAALVLSGLKLQYGLIIGAFAGLLYLVPYIGVLIIMLITGIIALVQPPHSLAYAGLLMAILAIQSFVIFDMVITPKVVGGSVGVHPLLALFSLTLGARLFGLVGMLAAVPVVASLQVAIGQAYPLIYEDVRGKTKKEKKKKKNHPKSNKHAV